MCVCVCMSVCACVHEIKHKGRENLHEFSDTKSQFLVIGLSVPLTQVLSFSNLLLVLTTATLVKFRFL